MTSIAEINNQISKKRKYFLDLKDSINSTKAPIVDQARLRAGGLENMRQQQITNIQSSALRSQRLADINKQEQEFEVEIQPVISNIKEYEQLQLDYTTAQNAADSGDSRAVFGLENARQKQFYSQIKKGQGAYTAYQKQMKEFKDLNLNPIINNKGEISGFEDTKAGMSYRLDELPNVLQNYRQEDINRFEKAGLISVSKVDLNNNQQSILFNNESRNNLQPLKNQIAGQLQSKLPPTKREQFESNVIRKVRNLNIKENFEKGTRAVFPKYVEEVPIFGFDLATSTLKGSIKAPVAFLQSESQRVLNPAEYKTTRAKTIKFFSTDPDTQTLGFLMLGGGVAGKTVQKAVGTGILGFQGYQTVKDPSAKNIAGFGLAAGLMGYSSYKDIKYLNTKSAIANLQSAKAKEVSVGLIKDKGGEVKQIIVESRKAVGKNNQRTISLFDVKPSGKGVQIQKGKVATEINIGKQKFYETGTFFGSGYESTATRLSPGKIGIRTPVNAKPVVVSIDFLNSNLKFSRQTGAAFSKLDGKFQKSILGRIDKGRIYFKEGDQRSFVNFNKGNVDTFGNKVRGKFEPSGVAILKDYSPKKLSKLSFRYIEKAEPSKIPVGSSEIQLANSINKNAIQKIDFGKNIKTTNYVMGDTQLKDVGAVTSFLSESSSNIKVVSKPFSFMAASAPLITSQVPKQEAKQTQILNVKINQKQNQKQNQDQDVRQILDLKPNLKDRLKFDSKPILSQKPRTDTAIKLSERQIQIPALEQDTSLKYKQNTRTNLLPRTEYKPKLTTKIRPKPFAFGFPKLEASKNTKQNALTGRVKRAYDVEIRRRGLFRKIGEGLPIGKALSLGTKRTTSTLAQTFRLKEKGTTVQEDIKFRVPNDIFTIPKKSVGFGFVERRGKTLKRGSGEILEIKQARRSRKSKGWW